MDFVLVSLILIPLFAAILQLGLALYVRNTLAACAQAGARYGSDENLVVAPDGIAASAASGRTASCISDALSHAYAEHVNAVMTTRSIAGEAAVPVVEVTVSSPLPVFGLFGIGDQTLRVTGDAMQELP